MPKRTPGQPERFVDRYRQRLTEEMADQGETDRSLADKLGRAGYPITFSAIYKTRTGTRQPAMDECYEVARALGYPSLDVFLDGPLYVRVARAANRVASEILYRGADLRGAVHEALHDLDRAIRDPRAIAAADAANPRWREELYGGMEADLRWIMRDQIALWGETLNRLQEIAEGIPQPDPDEVEALRAELVAHWTKQEEGR